MGSAQPTDEQNEQKLTDGQGESAVKTELSNKLASIQQSFEQAWDLKKYPRENALSSLCYKRSNDSAANPLNLQIESLLEKFQDYQSADQIHNDFFSIREFWYNQCKKVNENFRDSYLITLRIMEAFFICAYMDYLSTHIKAISVDGFVTNVEMKVDLQPIADGILVNYKADLSKSFREQSDQFKMALRGDLFKLNQKIAEHNDKINNALKARPISDVMDVGQLIQKEVAYTELTDNSAPNEFKRSKDELLRKKHTLIDEFLKDMKYQAVPLRWDDKLTQTSINDELKQLEKTIDSIKNQNQLVQIVFAAAFCLKNLLEKDETKNDKTKKEFKHSLMENILSFSERPGFFKTDKIAIDNMTEVFLTLNDELNKSPHVLKCKQPTSPVFIDDAILVEKQASLKKMLEGIKKQVEELANNEIMTEGFKQYREEVIAKERDVLSKLVSNYKYQEIVSVPVDYLKTRREQLDARWVVLLESPKNVAVLSELTKQLHRKAAQTSDDAMRNTYARTADFLDQKLEDYKFKAVDVLEEKEDKEIKKEEVTTQPGVRIADPARVAYQENNNPWYSINKPWKRALFAGLCFLIGAALIGTGVGLTVELSLTMILAVSLGSGGVLGLLGGAATYARHSHKSASFSEISNHPVHIKCNAVLRTVSAPSLFPVHAPNSLNDEDEYNCCCFGPIFSRPKQMVAQPSIQRDFKCH